VRKQVAATAITLIVGVKRRVSLLIKRYFDGPLIIIIFYDQ